MAKSTPIFMIDGDMPEVLRRNLVGSLIGFVVGTVTEITAPGLFYVLIEHIPGKPKYHLSVDEDSVPKVGTRVLLSGKKGIRATILDHSDTA